jgi:CRP-like cAMP-binding protein
MRRAWPGLPGNWLLASLSEQDRAILAPHLEPVPLPLGSRLISPGEPIEYVYFLDSGLGSDIALSGEDDKPVECGMVGREGLIGMPVILRSDHGVHAAEMQIAGHGFRIPSQELSRAMDQSASLRNALLRYGNYFMSHTAQTAACNARHSLSQRLARWLLMSHDRLDGDDVPLTHEYLSIMLGVRRAGVTQALHILEGERLIKAVRGQIKVVDRSGLEQASCACYGIVRRELDRLFDEALPNGDA